jgi:hypothetical protein
MGMRGIFYSFKLFLQRKGEEVSTLWRIGVKVECRISLIFTPARLPPWYSVPPLAPKCKDDFQYLCTYNPLADFFIDKTAQ